MLQRGTLVVETWRSVIGLRQRTHYDVRLDCFVLNLSFDFSLQLVDKVLNKMRGEDLVYTSVSHFTSIYSNLFSV